MCIPPKIEPVQSNHNHSANRQRGSLQICSSSAGHDLGARHFQDRCHSPDQGRPISRSETNSHLTVTFVAGMVLAGLAAWTGLAPQRESKLALGNDLSHFEGKSLSRVKIMLWIRYRYAGDKGESNICVSASALASDGSQYPDTVYGVAPVRIGEGTASLAITKRHGKAPGISERVRVCLQEGNTNPPFYCEIFPFAHSWSDNLPGEAPVRNEIGGFAVDPTSSKQEIPVQVNYAYTGDHGRNDIRMIAFWLRRNGHRAPATEGIPVRIGPGHGRAALKIRKGPSYALMPGDKLRVCMITSEGRAFSCEEFPRY
jgi:hypothetical protein